MAITEGLLTYDAEGMEGGPFHSRKFHVPSASSGLTIGRGYDMKEKTPEKIRSDMSQAGIPDEISATAAKAAGLSGDAARQFLKEYLEGQSITVAMQEALFQLTYSDLEADVKRICNKPDCVEVYGSVKWDALDSRIREVLVDLRYRGDYTPNTRKRLQKFVAENNKPAFEAVIRDKDLWGSVPNDRFCRRCAVFDVC